MLVSVVVQFIYILADCFVSYLSYCPALAGPGSALETGGIWEQTVDESCVTACLPLSLCPSSKKRFDLFVSVF